MSISDAITTLADILYSDNEPLREVDVKKFSDTIAKLESTPKNTVIALSFGIAGGCLGALDNILKRMSLREGLTGFLQWQNILIFIFSAILVIIAIILTQIGFFKGDSTSKQISAYNSFYIIMPIVIELIIFENASISVFKICAIILIILGVFFLSSSGTKKIIIPSIII